MILGFLMYEPAALALLAEAYLDHEVGDETPKHQVEQTGETAGFGDDKIPTFDTVDECLEWLRAAGFSKRPCGALIRPASRSPSDRLTFAKIAAAADGYRAFMGRTG